MTDSGKKKKIKGLIRISEKGMYENKNKQALC